MEVGLATQGFAKARLACTLGFDRAVASRLKRESHRLPVSIWPSGSVMPRPRPGVNRYDAQDTVAGENWYVRGNHARREEIMSDVLCG